MLDVLQDRLEHLLHHQEVHQMEWSDDTVQKMKKTLSAVSKKRKKKKDTNVFNEFPHSSLRDSATTENLNSISSSILTTGCRIALEESNLSSEFTRLLTIRLMIEKECQKKKNYLRKRKQVTMLHIWYVIFSSQLCTPINRLVKPKKQPAVAYSQLEKSFLQVWCESPLVNSRVCQRPFVDSSIYPEVISKMSLLSSQK